MLAGPLVALTLLIGPVHGAEDLRGWFVEMKRVGKDLRIAAAAGNDTVIRSQRASAHQLALRAGLWSLGSVNGDVAQTCRTAANTLLAAAEEAVAGRATAYSTEFGRYAEWENFCFLAFTRAEQRRSS